MRVGTLLEVLARPGSLAKSAANRPARTTAVAVPGAIESMNTKILLLVRCTQMNTATSEYGAELLEGFKGQDSQASPSPEAVSGLGVTRGEAGSVSVTEKAPAPCPRPCRRAGQTVTRSFIYWASLSGLR
jgi:hypothetical protein